MFYYRYLVRYQYCAFGALWLISLYIDIIDRSSMTTGGNNKKHRSSILSSLPTYHFLACVRWSSTLKPQDIHSRLDISRTFRFISAIILRALINAAMMIPTMPLNSSIRPCIFTVSLSFYIILIFLNHHGRIHFENTLACDKILR